MRPAGIDLDIGTDGGYEFPKRLDLEGYCIVVSDRREMGRLSQILAREMVYFAQPQKKLDLIRTLLHKGYRVLDLEEKRLYNPSCITPNRHQVIYETEPCDDILSRVEEWLGYGWVPQEIRGPWERVRQELENDNSYIVVEGERDKKAFLALFGEKYRDKIIVLNGGGKNISPLTIEDKIGPILCDGSRKRIGIWTDQDYHGIILEKRISEFLSGRAQIILSEEKRTIMAYAKRKCVEELYSFVECCKNKHGF